jgi:hypothetical protein
MLVTTPEQLNEVSWNLIFRSFTRIFGAFPILVRIKQQ